MNRYLIKILFLLVVVFSYSSYAEAEEFYLNYFDGQSSFMNVADYRAASQSLDPEETISRFSEYMLQNSTPTTKEFLQFIDSYVEPMCRGRWRYESCLFSKRKSFIIILRYRNKIDNLFFLIVDDHIRNFTPTLKDLKEYLQTLNSIYNYRKRTIPEDYNKMQSTTFLNTRNLSRNYAGYKGLLVRQVLYLKYNAFQIKFLSNVLKKALTVMNSPNAYVYVEMNDEAFEDLKFELSYTEKYRLGVKLLNHQLAKLANDRRFGFKPQLIDVLAAGIDTGIISVPLLAHMYNMEEFKDSYRNRYKIYWKVLKNIGKVLVINTPVIGQVSLIPIMIIETKQQIEEMRQEAANETHLF